MNECTLISYICFLAMVRNIHCLFYMGLVGHSKSNLETRIPDFCLMGGKVLLTLIMFPLIMAIDMFWNKFALALLFPLAMMVLVPISLSSSRPDGPHEPNVS